jgi:hypothetical protein
VKESIPGESLGAADSFLMPGRGSEQLRSRRRATPILFGRLVQRRNTYDQLIHSLGGGESSVRLGLFSSTICTEPALHKLAEQDTERLRACCMLRVGSVADVGRCDGLAGDA